MLGLGVLSMWLVFFIIVSRLHCESESFKMDLILDVNTQIYPIDLGMTFSHIAVRCEAVIQHYIAVLLHQFFVSN